MFLEDFYKAEKTAFKRLIELFVSGAQLDQEKPLKFICSFRTTRKRLKNLNLLSAKPVLYVANVGEDDVVEGGNAACSLKDEVGRTRPLLQISAEKR